MILAFVGVKMLLAEGIPEGLRGDWTPHWLEGLHIPIGLSLGIIAVVMAVTIGISMAFPEHHDDPDDTDGGSGGEGGEPVQPVGPGPRVQAMSTSSPSTSITS